jgi:predicted unusual protein kinase regulating ubiquinone biosynthesis (AarF/ABC1/UbiB family)
MVTGPQPHGALRRGYHLGKLGLSLTGSYLGYQAQNLWLGEDGQGERRRHWQKKVSRQVREELGSLKGAFMKFGQILSLQTQALPDEAVVELAGLQMRAPGMHPSLARAQFKQACGKYPDEVFREFEAEPFAAASLGQVHRALTKRGEKVAVKIQYPAIRTAIENDLKLLRAAALPGRVTGYLPVAILDEMQRGFLEETDYLHEGRNLDFFRERLSGYHFLSIPKVHWDLTTDRVLVMSFVEGATVGPFLESGPPPAVRDLIGHRLFELYHCQIQSLRALHADHHPGNYLFRPDGAIGMVDFGCVKRLSPDIAVLVHHCVDHAWRSSEEAERETINILWGSRIPYAKARRMIASLEGFLDIVYPLDRRKQHYVDFGQPAVLNSVAQNLRRAVRHKLTNAEFAFISRAELGLYSLLHQLRAKVDTLAAWRAVVERAGLPP